MSQSERIFSRIDAATGSTEWFFPARGGTFGPFNSKENAEIALEAFIKKCIQNNDDGGRKFGRAF